MTRHDPACDRELTTPDGERITVDRCVAPELERLWQAGVRTLCSCCGHGDNPGWITAEAGATLTMDRMGYERTEGHECIIQEGAVRYRPKEKICCER